MLGIVPWYHALWVGYQCVDKGIEFHLWMKFLDARLHHCGESVRESVCAWYYEAVAFA
jgi:hypothetical protein